MVHRLEIDHFAGCPGDAHFALVVEDLEPDARRLAALGIGEADVGDVDRRLLVDDPTGIAGRRARVALHHVHALHEHARFLAQHPQHLAGLALVLAGPDDHLVALPDLEFHCHRYTRFVARPPTALPAPAR